MTAPHVHIVKFEGRDVEYYGKVQEDSNFSVVCEDEYDDTIWTDGRLDGGWFSTWEDVVECLQREFDSDILEISAC